MAIERLEQDKKARERDAEMRQNYRRMRQAQRNTLWDAVTIYFPEVNGFESCSEVIAFVSLLKDKADLVDQIAKERDGLVSELKAMTTELMECFSLSPDEDWDDLFDDELIEFDEEGVIDYGNKSERDACESEEEGSGSTC